MKRFCVLVAALMVSVPGSHCFPPKNGRELAQTSAKEDIEFCCTDSLVGVINDLSFKLIKQIGGTDNLFISPLSISVALAMTYLGSTGNTAKQMERVLEFEGHNLEKSDIENGFRELLSALAHRNDEYSLFVANGMFLQDNFAVKPRYVDDLKQIYRASVKNLDFAGNGESAVKEINGWVARNTRNMIKKLFDQPLDALTRLVLLNAVYFKGTWKTQFPKDRTVEGQFFTSDDTSTAVDMMSLREESFRFFDDEETMHKFLEVPYKGDHIVMLLALSNDFNPSVNLEMTSDLLCRINSSMKNTQLETVALPKFRMEYTKQLKGTLADMGMSDLFMEGSANLTGIRDQNDIHVSSILHKAVIDVNEEGSEAAAVTGVVAVAYSSNFDPSFVANHPFLFYIIDKRNGLILFTGRVSKP